MYNLTLKRNYLQPNFISCLQLFTLTLNYNFSLNIVEAINYDLTVTALTIEKNIHQAFTTEFRAKFVEYSKFRSTSVLQMALKTWYTNYMISATLARG